MQLFAFQSVTFVVVPLINWGEFLLEIHKIIPSFSNSRIKIAMVWIYITIWRNEFQMILSIFQSMWPGICQTILDFRVLHLTTIMDTCSLKERFQRNWYWAKLLNKARLPTFLEYLQLNTEQRCMWYIHLSQTWIRSSTCYIRDKLPLFKSKSGRGKQRVNKGTSVSWWQKGFKE